MYVRSDMDSFHIGNINETCEACLIGVNLAGRTLPIIEVYRSPSLSISDPSVFVLRGIGQIIASCGTCRDLIWFSDSNIDLSEDGHLGDDL